MVYNGLTFMKTHMVVEENTKSWGGPRWILKDVRGAYKTDGKACDYFHIPDRVRFAIYHITRLGPVPFASQSNTALRDTIVAYADDGSNLRLRLAKSSSAIGSAT
ncbi:hypothetical protein FCOIX_6135 [Fusarium coicis]|nr:hypothetical protein FCOIX_6135 [Fusarium coicis]